MRHLTNFWLRTADAIFNDDYARYVDYVGRAHTSHGADPRIYIAERYVIGQVGFMQHAITEVLVKELYVMDEVLTIRAQEAWSKFMMVPIFLENDQVILQVPDLSVQPAPTTSPAAVPLAAMKARQDNEFKISDVPPGTAKCVETGDRTIAVFNVAGQFYATENECTHAEGPLCEGALEGATIECPWHGSKFDVRTGAVVTRPAKDPLKTYRVTVDGEIGRVEAG